MRRDTIGNEASGADDNSDETLTFGDRLVLAREAAGCGQALPALRMGRKPQTPRNWEEDRPEPPANRLRMLAGLLNVSLARLMSGQGEAPMLGPSPVREGAAEACLAELRGLRAEQIRLVERMSRLEKRMRAVLG